MDEFSSILRRRAFPVRYWNDFRSIYFSKMILFSDEREL